MSTDLPTPAGDRFAEGHAAGVAEERARLMAIDSFGLTDLPDLVRAGKYLAPMSPGELAIAALRVRHQILTLIEAHGQWAAERNRR